MKQGCSTANNDRYTPNTVWNVTNSRPRRRTTDDNRSIQPLSSILWSLMNHIGGERRVKEIIAASAWNAVVGPEIAKRTAVLSVKEGRLYVGVETSTWAHQLTLLKAEILSRLNRKVGEVALRDIRFRVGVPQQLPEDVAFLQRDQERHSQDRPPSNRVNTRPSEVTTEMLFEAFEKARAAARAHMAPKDGS